MVQLGLPDEYKEVNVDQLKSKDKAVILHVPGESTRVYMISPNADGKSGVLYYFYKPVVQHKIKMGSACNFLTHFALQILTLNPQHRP